MHRTNQLKWNRLFIITGIVFLHSCSWFGGSEYTKLAEKELARGVRYDSLFMGFYLGMPAKGFYDYCWDMNKKGVFTNGTENVSVLYKMNNKELKYPALMNFYPDFYANKIAGMRVSFEYSAWAPWNRAQYGDSLLPDVLNMYRKWYPDGNGFIKMTDKKRGTIYIKVDGNRRITIGNFDDRLVKVDYTDLLIEEALKKQKK